MLWLSIVIVVEPVIEIALPAASVSTVACCTAPDELKIGMVAEASDTASVRLPARSRVRHSKKFL